MPAGDNIGRDTIIQSTYQYSQLFIKEYINTLKEYINTFGWTMNDDTLYKLYANGKWPEVRAGWQVAGCWRLWRDWVAMVEAMLRLLSRWSSRCGCWG